MKELPRVDAQSLDVLPLAFREERIQSQTALARTTGTSDDHQLAAWNIEVDVPEVVRASTTNPYHLGRTCLAGDNRFRAGGCGHAHLVGEWSMA